MRKIFYTSILCNSLILSATIHAYGKKFGYHTFHTSVTQNSVWFISLYVLPKLSEYCIPCTPIITY